MALAKGKNRANLLRTGDRIVVEVKRDKDGNRYVCPAEVLTPTVDRDIRHVTVTSVRAERHRADYGRRSSYRIYHVAVDLDGTRQESWGFGLQPVQTVLVGDPIGAKPRKVKAAPVKGSSHRERVTAALVEQGWHQVDNDSRYAERWELDGHRPLVMAYTEAGQLQRVGHPGKSGWTDGPDKGKLAWVLDTIAAPADMDPADHQVTVQDTEDRPSWASTTYYHRTMTCTCGWDHNTHRNTNTSLAYPDGNTPEQRLAEQFREAHGFDPAL